MNETNFDWDDLRLFLSVARQGGLAGAATETGKSAPTLGRRMLDLEKSLGHDLFHRHARGYSLTEEGERLLLTARTLEESLAPWLEDSERKTKRVKLSAGTWVSYYLSLHVGELIQSQTAVQFIAADHVLDIAHREAVVGVRNQRPTQHHLAARRIGKIEFAVYGSSKKVSSWVKVLSSTPSSRWVDEHLDQAAAVEVTHPRNALDMAEAGAVRAVLPTFIGDATDSLRRLSKPIEALEHTQWLVTHHEDRHLQEVRDVIDWVFDTLTAESP